MESDKIKKLKELSELYKSGILTKEELEIEKKKVLEGNTTPSTQTNLIKEKEPVKPVKAGEPYVVDDVKMIDSDLNKDKDKIKLTPNKKRALYIIATLVILIGVGVFFGLYQHHQTVVAQQREQARLDSIAEVERIREQHRQDSIAEVERIRREREEFINSHPLLASTFFIKDYEYPSIHYRDDYVKNLKELGFEKSNSSYINYSAGTDGSSWECLKVIFQRNNTYITLITQKEDINNVYDTEVNFDSETELSKFMQSAVNIGFKKYDESYYYYRDSGWGIYIKGKKVTIRYAP